jgi:bacillithiol synthase
MQVEKIALKDTHSFSSILLNYLSQSEELKPFYSFAPTMDGIIEATHTHQLGTNERAILRDALLQQYQDVALSDSSRANIQSLANTNTFTITTGHQLNIFTGPLYFIYKIVSVINACKSLNQKHPEPSFCACILDGNGRS